MIIRSKVFALVALALAYVAPTCAVGLLWNGSSDIPMILPLDDAFSINDNGVILGVVDGRPVMYSAATGLLTEIGLPANYYLSQISNSGIVIGSNLVDGYSNAFRWSQQDGLTPLGTLGGRHSSPQSVNDSGLVVGQSTDAEGYLRAFIWSPWTGMHAVGPVGIYNAIDINNLGQILCAYNPFPYRNPQIAECGTTVRAITSLPFTPVSSTAVGINDAGWVLARAVDSDVRAHTFLWSPTTGATQMIPELNFVSLLDINNSGVVLGLADGWITWDNTAGIRHVPAPENALTYDVRDINNLGQMVGTFQPIPEPATWMSVFGGVLGFGILATTRSSRQS